MLDNYLKKRIFIHTHRQRESERERDRNRDIESYITLLLINKMRTDENSDVIILSICSMS